MSASDTLHPHDVPRRRLAALPLTSVSLDGPFWGPRLETNCTRTIPHLYREIERTGMLAAYDLSLAPPPLPFPKSPGGTTPVMWWDSDVAKWIEAASYSLSTHPNPELEKLVNDTVERVIGAQQPDGYLNTYFSTREPEHRFSNERDWHELYCAGHMIEAAVAHFTATGSRRLLDAVCRYADRIASEYGRGSGQRPAYPGHEEIELALVRLARATGQTRFLEQAAYFVDERGRQPHYFDAEARARGQGTTFGQDSYEYMQAHKPVREQDVVVGHAVRAMYLYAAMADLAAERGDQPLLDACHRLWDNLVTKRLYITGGLGPSARNEGMTNDYDLPNDTAYAETCAAVGLVFWAQRLLELELDARYADVMERALYNNVLAGVSLDGESFFYDNPLESRGDQRRFAWHACPCCPPNLARLVGSLGLYAYGANSHEIAVHLYVGGTVRAELGGHPVALHLETRYPWDGLVSVCLETATPARFTLSLRVPGWCRSASLRVNGHAVNLEGILERGYARLEREWHDGDRIELGLAMPIELVHAHPAIRADAGLVALQRGPLVYCLEETDQTVPLHEITLEPDKAFESRFEPDVLGGMVVLEGRALVPDVTEWGNELYRPRPPRLLETSIRAIPYFAWGNREPGEMRVWLRAPLEDMNT